MGYEDYANVKCNANDGTETKTWNPKQNALLKI